MLQSFHSWCWDKLKESASLDCRVYLQTCLGMHFDACSKHCQVIPQASLPPDLYMPKWVFQGRAFVIRKQKGIISACIIFPLIYLSFSRKGSFVGKTRASKEFPSCLMFQSTGICERLCWVLFSFAIRTGSASSRRAPREGGWPEAGSATHGKATAGPRWALPPRGTAWGGRGQWQPSWQCPQAATLPPAGARPCETGGRGEWVRVHAAPPASPGRAQAQGPRRSHGARWQVDGQKCHRPAWGLPPRPLVSSRVEKQFWVEKKKSTDNDNSAKLTVASWHRK